MQCQNCGRDVASDAAFCPSCGQRISAAPAAQTASSDQPSVDPLHPARAVERIRQDPTGFGSEAPQEEDLWEGGYSPKAMYGRMLLVAIITAVCFIAVAMFWNTAVGWLSVAAGVAILWAVIGLSILYRRMAVHYRLTRYRLFHQHGLVLRVTDRIETIDIDDVSVKQTLLARMLDIGTIVVMSSDRTVPQLRMEGIDHVNHVADLIDNTRRAERQRRGLHLEAT
jgi:membrane protein YdbS with pleckstrin-like domain